MHSKIMIVFLFFLLLKKINVNGIFSIESRYEFYMFENFEGTKEVYIQEGKVTNKILDFKRRILELQNELKALAGGKLNSYMLSFK